MLDKYAKLLPGLKSYLLWAAVAVLGAINGLHEAHLIAWTVPAWVYIVLSPLGVAARAVASPKTDS